MWTGLPGGAAPSFPKPAPVRPLSCLSISFICEQEPSPEYALPSQRPPRSGKAARLLSQAAEVPKLSPYGQKIVDNVQKWCTQHHRPRSNLEC